jgi:hypothetical protein
MAAKTTTAGLAWLLAALFSGSEGLRAQVVINEILYHASDELEDLEFIELHNPGAEAVDISGWSLAKAVRYRFPTVTSVEAGGYIIVVKNEKAFRSAYGPEPPIAGEYLRDGLGDRGEALVLRDRDSRVVEEVRYDDEQPWPVSADGAGASLERIHPQSPPLPFNWDASPLAVDLSKPQGTPGRVNSCFSLHAPPRFLYVTFAPACPRPGDAVRVEARVAAAAGVAEVELVYSLHELGKPGSEVESAMAPIGAAEGGGRFEASIPGAPSGCLIRFHVKARSQEGAERIFPSPNALRPSVSYYVHGAEEPKTVPHARVLGFPDQQQRRSFGFRFGSGPSADLPPRGTSTLVWVSADERRWDVYDHVQVRRRGGGFKVYFHKDHPLKLRPEGFESDAAVKTANLIFEGDLRHLVAERLAYEVYRRAGVPSPVEEVLRLSVAGRELGAHLLVEQPNRAFLRRNGRGDGGNLYKILWYESDIVRKHEKKTNVRGGHGDLLAILKALGESRGEAQWELIQEHFNVEECASYFAASMCLSNWDGFFNNYFTYHDAEGVGWEIYPWDEDKTWGQHDGQRSGVVFFDMPLSFGADGGKPDGTLGEPETGRGGGGFGGFGGFGGLGGFGRPWWREPGPFSGPLLANAQFRARFLRRLRELVDGVYTEEGFLPLIDGLEKRLEPEIERQARLEGGDAPAELAQLRACMETLREHLRKRRAFILAQEELSGAK